MNLSESIDGDIYMSYLEETSPQELERLKAEIINPKVIKSLMEGNIGEIEYLPLEMVVQILASELHQLKQT